MPPRRRIRTNIQDDIANFSKLQKTTALDIPPKRLRNGRSNRREFVKKEEDEEEERIQLLRVPSPPKNISVRPNGVTKDRKKLELEGTIKFFNRRKPAFRSKCNNANLNCIKEEPENKTPIPAASSDGLSILKEIKPPTIKSSAQKNILLNYDYNQLISLINTNFSDLDLPKVHGFEHKKIEIEEQSFRLEEAKTGGETDLFDEWYLEDNKERFKDVSIF